ncbi:oxygenase MpaB family protein [Actinoplanes sp. NEAU-A12]|uniref:Oxygenase MpaB family protein n=1 Tax=Actinoplanes sandaracinus TaxID=3045177 RepID=A0ABT6WYA1_9ACTN|nr:oxygenase MpaB family protein [Actinoplanes sandaracinus]MDI6104712.1 oxygenase MpaB family protein [Actinoplanes sandaracinus]
MDDGLFDDSAVIRRVAREGFLLAGGGRATLLQIAHPGVAQGVYDHSDFAERPLDRLRTTMSYVFGVLFGTVAEGRAISRAVAAIHRKVTGPGYRADDPGLQVWVNATLYDTAVLLYQRVFGPLTPAELDECFRQYSVLATSIGCPEDAWPADRAAFTAYWDRTVDTLRVGDEAREIAAALMRPRNIPIVLRPARPLNRLVTVGLLPEPIRAQYGFSWSAPRQRLFDAFFGTARVVYPRLPGRLRDGVKDYYLHDLRRRLNRRRDPLTAGERQRGG